MADAPTDGVFTGDDGLARCWWCRGDPLYLRYHDLEWGRPLLDDQRLFEKISLEGFMAGLSWLTILRKRESFREAFQGFEIEAVARFDIARVDELLLNPAIVRNRAKVEATINNAQRCLELIEDRGSLTSYVWSYRPAAGDRPEELDWPTLAGREIPGEASAMSKDLKRRGWRFVGPTSVYSLMESAGLVNDHMAACHFQPEVGQEQAAVRSDRRIKGSRTRRKKPSW